MSKSTKAILTGVGTFVLCLAVIVCARSLIKSTPVVDNLKSIWNWVFALAGGISSGWKAWTKESKNNDKQ